MENQFEMNSIYGKGIFYVTTNAVVIEINQKGILFERLHSQIASIEALDDKKIKITWPEEKQLFDFTFKIENAKEHIKTIVETYNYEDNFPDLMGISITIISEKQQKNIIEKRTKSANKSLELFRRLLDEANLQLNMISKDDPDKSHKILDAADKTSRLQNRVTMWTGYLKDIASIAMNRSKKIPKDIPDSRCWNDCWYDEQSDCFVTFNHYLNQSWLLNFEKVKKFTKENQIPNVYAVPFEMVWFLHGYPIISPEIAERLKMTRTFLPTMTDDMLTDTIISKKYPDVHFAKILTYSVSSGSKLTLKNDQKYKFTRKETVFFLNKKMIPKDELDLLP